MNGSVVVCVLQGQLFHNLENCPNFKQLDIMSSSVSLEGKF